MAEVSPTGSSGGIPYKPQYTVSPQFEHFWEKMFPGTSLTSKQVHEMTDQFVRNVWNQMNHTLQWALKQQKERAAREKKEERGE